MRFAVGDMVVYGSHGAGPVAARTSKDVLGARQEVIVLELASGLRVELPLERAHELLRPLADESEIARVQEVLGADQAANGDTWLKRQRSSLAKLSNGSPTGLAEIIRDSARREGTLSAKGSKSQLSPSERDLLTKARHLLSTEIALVRGIETEEADTWIDRQLGRVR